jgi:two-component system, sensor histidine kinase and response regulator
VQLKSTPATPRLPEARCRDLSDLCVLVVDDNATNRRILRHQLGAWQMRADSAPVAREPLGSCEPQLKLGNRTTWRFWMCRWRRWSGLTLVRAIKADRALADTRLIALTSFGQAFSAAELKTLCLPKFWRRTITPRSCGLPIKKSESSGNACS